MNITQLGFTLKNKKINPDAIRLGTGLPDANEQYCIVENKGKWEVYYAEKGQKGSLRTFDREEEACTYLMSILEDDGSVWIK